MRVFVTGAIGFVGRWLERELVANGHVVVAAPGPEAMDIADRRALIRWLDDPAGRPDAVIHLAGMAFATDAARDPAEALRVNLGGTAALFEALRELGIRPPVLVSGSADVYGSPRPGELPLSEEAAIAPVNSYGLSKMAQEAIAAEASLRHGFDVVVTRSFNHTGPGQRPVFVVPALAGRVISVKRGATSSIPVGNLDVRRDLSDVRDVVVAYRLLLEWLARNGGRGEFRVINVASGRSVSVREIVERLCAMAGIEPVLEIDASLVRSNDPSEIVGDAAKLHSLVNWRPTIPLDRTLADVLAACGAEG